MKTLLHGLTLAILASGCTTGSGTSNPPQDFAQTAPSTQAATAKQQVELDTLLQSFIDEKKAANLAAFVAQDGEILYAKAFGQKNLDNKAPASLEDYYVLFSQTKAVTTVAFMTLVERGLVNIHDPVARYFPEIPDSVLMSIRDDGSFETRPAKQPMTFVHLMAHTSGLDAGLAGEARQERSGAGAPIGFGGEEPAFQPSGQRTGGGNYQAEYLQEEMLALAAYPLGFDPGTQWNYHISTNMLAYLIERISGQSLRDYVKSTILDPLGMDQTDWFYEPAALERFVTPYSAIDGMLVPGSEIYMRGTVTPEKTYAEGAIGLNGPITDYAKFAQMLLNRGEFNGQRILKPETVELMTTINRLPPPEEDAENFQFGLGFELYNADKKPAPAVSNSAYAWGGLMGTEYIIDPENNLIALFYLNMYQREALYPQFLNKAYKLINREE